MNKFRISREGVEMGEYAKAEIEHLAAANYFQPTDYYWTEGMPGWQPLTELLGPIAQPLALRPVPLEIVRPVPPLLTQLQQFAPPVPPPVVVNVQQHVISHYQPMPQPMVVLAANKSGLAAAMLNLIIPGLGYMYCGRVLLGIFVFFFTVILVAGSGGVLGLVLYPILFIGGFLCADRANKRVIIIR